MNRMPTTDFSSHLDHEAFAASIRDGIVRALAAVVLAAVALIHLLDLPGSWPAQGYKGWMYVGLIVACLGAAAALVHRGDRRAWLAAAALPVFPLVGYVVSRTVGIPGGADDIGNWAEPLGLASLFVEGSLIALAASVLAPGLLEGRVGRPPVRLHPSARPREALR
jgi:hypothetical protein